MGSLEEYGKIGICPKFISHALRTANSVYIPLELCNCGSLDMYLREGQIFSEEGIRQVGFFIINVLKYFQENKKIHRNINPRHILVISEEKTGKIYFRLIGCQFLLDLATEVATTKVGSPEYSAPENDGQQEYSFPADIWSLGITLFELAVGALPSKIDPDYLLKLDKGESINFPHNATSSLSDCFCDLINCCVRKNPNERYTIAQLMEHPFFTRKPFTKIPPAIPKEKNPEFKPPKELDEEEQLKLIKNDFYEFMKYVIERDPIKQKKLKACLLYTSPSPRDLSTSRMPSSA
eukprot:TRINITY_DN7466_c0_g1_i1.p1 TRINITY_DN7466_c0_g1~~TRINITY_DN7466_c0_g1_i1.p1  ORF type:complete len:293 (+),score=46.95 TRINITY_DN7466_c0_g1_i1:201-1079(+)